MGLLDRRSLAWSVGLHATAALALVVAGCVSWFRLRDEPDEILAEFVVEPPGDPEAADPPPPEPEPEPEPDPEPDDIPVPDPPKPEPPRPEPPKPEPPKKKPIEVSRKVVTFDKPAPPQPAPPPKVETRKIGTKGSSLSEEEYRRMLDLGATVSDHTSIPADEASRCAALVRDQLYRAWKRPDSSAITGTPPTIAISLSDAGTVLGVELRRSSGNAALDESAVRAARAAGTFRNLTPRFIRANKPLVIQFQLTGA